MRFALKLLLPLLILALGFGLLRYLVDTKPEPQAAKIQERVWRVEVEAVTPGNRHPELTLYGRVQTPSLLKVTASGSARVAEVAVRDGDSVTEGQLLVRLDERDFLPDLHQAQAEVAELQAHIQSEANRLKNDRRSLQHEKTLLAIAGDAVTRAQRLTKQRVGSETDLDRAEESLARQALRLSERELSIEDHPARLKALEARLQRVRARLADIELDYERARSEAPFDAVVAGVEVTAGDQVKEHAVLLRLYTRDGLEVRARIPAPFQAEIRKALNSGESLSASADLAGVPVALRLDRVAGEARPSGVDGLFSVHSNARLLRLGQMLSLRLVRPPQPEAVALPPQAVYGEGRIYRLIDGRMRGTRVRILGAVGDARGGERLLVRSPELAAGDLVVTTHMPNAVEGLPVEAVR